MKPEHREIAGKVCSDVFEQLAFMFCEEIDIEDITPEADSYMLVQMTYCGGQTGTIEMIVPTRLAENLAINIMGIDDTEEMEPGAASDALQEILNTICGRMMTAIYGEQVVIDLTVPHAQTITVQQWQELSARKEYLALDIEDEPVLIHFE